MLRLYGEAGVATRQEVPQHGGGLADCPGVGQAQFGDQLVLKGLRHALDPARPLQPVSQSLWPSFMQHKPD